MHSASIHTGVWQIPINLPAAGFRPLCLLIIPIITQVVYRTIRNNMYSQMSRLDDFQPNSPKMQQRKFQHTLYTGAALIQLFAFGFFGRTNRFYCIPAVFGLTLFAWTDFTKRQEKIVGNTFESMDRNLPIN